jgi:ketosteroid isomerase-like protein
MRNISTISTFIFLFLILSSCIGKNNEKNKKANAILELEKAELAFSKMAADSGIQSAFTHFAHENAIIKRQNDTLIKGISAIHHYYNDKKSDNVKLTWIPDFVDVSESGELGYTYGKYKFIQTDSSGKQIVYKGIFHTVWKKNEAGEWKFVWD